jgi:putative membrane protein
MLAIKLKSLFLFTLLSTVILQGCKDDDDQNNYTMSNQSFVEQASSSNNFEVAAGNLALLKSVNENVKNYGNHMVTEHTAVGTEMTNLATSKGLTVPKTLLAKDQANLDLLANATTDAFDKEFARIMVASHQDAINLFTSASSNTGVQDADLRNFASSKLPALKSHLQDALTLQAEVNQ